MKFKEQLKKVKGPTADNIKRRFVDSTSDPSTILFNISRVYRVLTRLLNK